jgi:hypothetical protein
MIRVTVYATRGGIRRPGDPVVWTKDMTHDHYEGWCTARDREWRQREMQAGYVVETK